MFVLKLIKMCVKIYETYADYENFVFKITKWTQRKLIFINKFINFDFEPSLFRWHFLTF